MLLKKATDEAQAERQRLLDEARKDADSLRAKRRDALRNEQRNLGQDIVRWTQKQVLAITRKALADLAATSLEERMAAVFIRRLCALAGAAKEQMAASLKTSTAPARVRSAFDLQPEQRAAIQKALNETFSADIHIQFETVPELINGIELSTNGQKLAWSIAEYLGTLEKSASELLQEDAKPESMPPANSHSGDKTDGKPLSNLQAKKGPEPAASAPKAEH